MSTALRMFLLQYGAERVSKSLSLEGGSHHLNWEPLLGIAVETSAGWVLLDTGMSRSAHLLDANTAAYRAGGEGAENVDAGWHLHPLPPETRAWNWIVPGDPVETALATIGLTPSDISLAAVSHLHVDHSGGIPTLVRARVPIAIQRDELWFARARMVGIAEGFHEPDWTEPGTQWRELNGDTEIAPGVHAISTPGHTPGHMSFSVELEETGTWIFGCDAADLGQNFLDRVPCGSCAGGTATDVDNAHRSLDKLLTRANESQGRLIPGHDQLVANAIRHPRGGHR
jgi:N-acyl homoserine lactone hydrolase